MFQRWGMSACETQILITAYPPILFYILKLHNSSLNHDTKPKRIFICHLFSIFQNKTTLLSSLHLIKTLITTLENYLHYLKIYTTSGKNLKFNYNVCLWDMRYCTISVDISFSTIPLFYNELQLFLDSFVIPPTDFMIQNLVSWILFISIPYMYFYFTILLATTKCHFFKRIICQHNYLNKV